MDPEEEVTPESEAQIELIEMQLRRPDTVSPWRLNGVNWRVEAGEFWAVGGLHWSGKSNLLTTAAAINPRSRGRLNLFGRNTADMKHEDLHNERLRIGLVFEGDGRLFPNLTVAENIALPLRYRTGRDDEELEERVWFILEALGLLDVASNTPGAIDLGKKRRVALGRAAVLRPEVFLFDQPLAGLDYRQRNWWRDLLEELSRGHALMEGQPATVVVTAENLRTWIHHARQFAMLGDGAFTTVGDRERMIACDDPLARDLMESEQTRN